jgi:hypothetical protein
MVRVRFGYPRLTVSRYSEQGSKCTGISIAGSSEKSDSKCTISIAGAQSVIQKERGSRTLDVWP